METVIEDTDNWMALKRGGGWSFAASDAQLQFCLRRALLPTFAPYRLIAITLVKHGNTWEHNAHLFTIDHFIHASLLGYWEYFIWSEPLSPNLVLNPTARKLEYFGLNGLLQLHHGRRFRDEICRSYLGVISKVGTYAGDQMREFPEYVKIYNALKRALVIEIKKPTVE